MEKPKRRTLTSPGLGGSGLHAKPTTPPVSGVRERKEPSGALEREERAEKVSTRRARGSRPPVRVDEVGEAAVALAARLVRTSAPKVLKTRRELAQAPLDHRDAFILSLIDSKTSVQGLVDLSGMPHEETVAILERLARLSIISLS
jgi:hypothetical protein